ncbi:MAG: hypothetical protein QNJ65_21715 [Xenococcaceae cyanobacterium MO_234.B1]|nr:hypothetical protein [Xenococcaceae cyanobacterium MO_234.B1]
MVESRSSQGLPLIRLGGTSVKDVLDLAISYLKLVPQAKQWLWAVIKVWVKDSFWQLFPGYYQALSPP